MKRNKTSAANATRNKSTITMSVTGFLLILASGGLIKKQLSFLGPLY